jgi:DNA-binding NarL/FixJ family response regulator
MKEKIKIAVVEDDSIYRMVLVNYLQQLEGFDVIHACSNGKELIEAILQEKPDIVVSDLKMPVMDGIKTTEYLNKHHPEIKILILTTYSGENLSRNLIEKGANIFLLKNNGLEQVPDAIYTLFKYDYYFADWSSKKINYAKKESKKFKANDVNSNTNIVVQDEIILNDQEITILKYLCEGLSNKEIAEKLHRSSRTVEKKRPQIFFKTNTNNIAELVRFALRNKII